MAGGVPGKVLADRMGCLRGRVVANVVVPTGQYVRFASHYGFRPDFCEAADSESKGMMGNLVGNAKTDLMIPKAPFGDLAAANAAAAAWCAEVNGAVHCEICAVPAERLVTERPAVLAAGSDRQAGHPQGGPTVVRAVRLSPLLRPRPGRSGCALTTGGCWSPWSAPGRSPPSTPSSRPVRRRSMRSTTAARGRRRGGRCGRRPRRRRSSAGSARSPGRSSPPSAGRSRSAGGTPLTCAPSSLPGPGQLTPAGDALVLDLPAVPVRPLADYALRALS